MSTHELIKTLFAIHKKVHPDAKHERPRIAKLCREALKKHDADAIEKAFGRYLATRTEYLVSKEHPIPVFLGQIDEWVKKSEVGSR